ncbi:uncharacterized protein DEA37_0004639 [Paragonimus westermani]|uniref:Uncharacterized protein n=1 Tax=Paragonimus westermani TaxID=34504 RepID=A0A5J4N7X9_9TREM|nr:uncharacterized protein DEA37_0004639 [Paragonimus westermani]
MPCSNCFQLYARQLNETITYMYQNKRYNQMVFYVEAPFSGFMFDDILSPKIRARYTQPESQQTIPECETGHEEESRDEIRRRGTCFCTSNQS